jgi:hypothetical protein
MHRTRCPLGLFVVTTVVLLLAATGTASYPEAYAASLGQAPYPLATTPPRASTLSTAPQRVAYTWDPGYTAATTGSLRFRTPDQNLTVCGHDAPGYPKLAIDPPANAPARARVPLTQAHCNVYKSGIDFVSVVWADVTIQTQGTWTVRLTWNGGTDTDSFAFSYALNGPQITSLTSSRSSVSYKDCLSANPVPVTLAWKTANATSTSLTSPSGTQNVGPTGSRTVSFPCDGLGHDYVLSATGSSGSTAKTLHVGFRPSTPQVVDFASAPAAVSPRFCATAGPHQIVLSWRTVDSSEVMISGPGVGVTTNETTGSRAVTLPCDGQPHDFTLTARGYVGPSAPTSARTVTVRQVGAAIAAACKYAITDNHNWVHVGDVHVVAVSGAVTWVDPTGTAIPSIPAEYSPPGGTTVKAGTQASILSVRAGTSQVRFDLTPQTQLQFGVPEDPWSWVEVHESGTTLVRITNAPEPTPTTTQPAAPGPQGCVVTDVATAFELEAAPQSLTVRDFQDSVVVGDRAPNPDGKLRVETVTTGDRAIITAAGEPSSPARMKSGDYERIKTRYGIEFPMPAGPSTGPPWWIWVLVGATVILIVGIGAVFATRRHAA